MRYTLRLLTLDQLARAAGVVCALELMRTDPANVDERAGGCSATGRSRSACGSARDASPNRLGGKGNDRRDDRGRPGAALQERAGQARAGAAQGLPVVRHAVHADSLSPACRTTSRRPNLEIRCANAGCDFTRDRPLPILTVDEPIYRRLPAFLIATVDKFAGLPWVGETGAFFGHVDRFDDERRLLRRGRAGRGTAARQWLVARPARPDHPGRAAPDLRPARHRGRALRDGDRPARLARRSASSASGRRSSPRPRRCGAPSDADPGAVRPRRARSIFPPPGHRPRRQLLRAAPCRRSRSPARLYLGVAAPGPRPEARVPARADDAAGRRAGGVRRDMPRRDGRIRPIPT